MLLTIFLGLKNRKHFNEKLADIFFNDLNLYELIISFQ